MNRKQTLSIVLFCLFVLSLGVGFYLFFENQKKNGKESVALDTQKPVTVGKRYRIFVRSIIVPAMDEDGDHWDNSGGSEAPDIYFKIIYQGNQIYESSTIDDSLVAEYSPVKAGILDVLTQKNASDYLEAANVACENSSADIGILVLDSDTVSDDEIGDIIVKLTDLKEGNNNLRNGDLKVIVTVIDSDRDINGALRELKLIE